MDPARRRRLRLPVVLTCNFLVLAFVLSCCNPPKPAATHATISVCAVDVARAADFPNDACYTGTFHATGAQQALHITAVDKNGAALPNAQIKVTVAGANARSDTATTDASGKVTYLYSGSHTGTDTISATLSSDSAAKSAHPAVVHWLAQQHVTHPVVLVHGIQEDATDFAHQFDPSVVDSDQASDGSKQTWTALIEALKLTYDPTYMKAFCYVDDVAWRIAPSACPADEAALRDCDPSLPPSSSGPPYPCISQGSVDESAVALAHVVVDLSAAAGNKPVTLMAYSMGGAVTRTLLAGCLNSAASDQLLCQQADGLVNDTIFLDGAQQGSWLLTVKHGFNAATLSVQNITPTALSAFSSVLPLIEQNIYGVVNQKLGLNLNNPAETDLTPQSANILAHNSVQPAANVQIYTFYGDVEFGMDVTYFIYTLPANAYLPMGDLVMLAQDDNPLASPLWGGGSLCDSCGPLVNGYHENGRYHAWALTQKYTVNINGLVPILSVPDAVSAFQQVVNSPVQHLNVSQPVTQAPGTAIQVADSTHLAGTATTDMPYEILLVLMHGDGLI